MVILVFLLALLIFHASNPFGVLKELRSRNLPSRWVWKSWRSELATLPVMALGPIVVPIALLFCKRTDTKLPAWASWWNNNISINGDSGGVQLPDGSWVGYKDVQDWVAVKDCLQVTYDDPRYGGTAYYAPRNHPTDFWARYKWLAFRNPASGYSHTRGVLLATTPQLVVSGKDFSFFRGTTQDGETVYQFRSEKRYKYLRRQRNYGVKLDLVYNEPWFITSPVPYVAIGNTYKGLKKE